MSKHKLFINKIKDYSSRDNVKKKKQTLILDKFLKYCFETKP